MVFFGGRVPDLSGANLSGADLSPVPTSVEQTSAEAVATTHALQRRA